MKIDFFGPLMGLPNAMKINGLSEKRCESSFTGSNRTFVCSILHRCDAWGLLKRFDFPSTLRINWTLQSRGLNLQGCFCVLKNRHWIEGVFGFLGQERPCIFQYPDLDLFSIQPWVVPPPSNSHHQDCYVFSRGSL